MAEQAADNADGRIELTIDELAHRADVPVRTIREYQTVGVLPAPDRRGRVGIYRQKSRRPSRAHRSPATTRLFARGHPRSPRAGATVLTLGEILDSSRISSSTSTSPARPRPSNNSPSCCPHSFPTRLRNCSRPASSRRADRTATACPAPRCCNSPSTRSPPVTTRTRPRAAHDHRRCGETHHRRSVATLTDPPDTSDRDEWSSSRSRPRSARTRRRTPHHPYTGRRMGITDETACPTRCRAFLKAERARPASPTPTASTRGTGTAASARPPSQPPRPVLVPVADALLDGRSSTRRRRARHRVRLRIHNPRRRRNNRTTRNAYGIDLSAPMLDVARQRRDQAGLTNAEFAQATRRRISSQSDFDIAISRFGTMFFADPVAAFANIGLALRPHGRLCLATWQPLTANDWLTIPARRSCATAPSRKARQRDRACSANPTPRPSPRRCARPATATSNSYR